jgi:RNA polymerase sigma-70 factor (ECF subfamily)
LSKTEINHNQTEQLSDEDTGLVKAFQNGATSAFDTLVLKHQDRVYNLCYRFLSDEQDANDAAQEAFVKAFQGLKRFRLESSFSTWLYRIAVNTCKNKLKSQEFKHRQTIIWIDAPIDGQDGDNRHIEIPDLTQSPELRLAEKEKLRQIQKAIHTLPIEQKLVVVLRDMNGLGYDEISEVTGYKLGTVKSKLSRARQELRKQLKGII